MFGWFKKKDAPTWDDRVWLHDAARLRAVGRDALPGPTLIVAFFEDSLARVGHALTAAGVPFQPAPVGYTPWGDAPVRLTTAAHLDRITLFPEGLRVVVYEHHPLPYEDGRLREALAARTSARPLYHSALDEPLLERLGGERLEGLMTQLGLTEDEPVEHPLVTAALKNAREKIAAKVRNPREASSMREWFERNLD